MLRLGETLSPPLRMQNVNDWPNAPPSLEATREQQTGQTSEAVLRSDLCRAAVSALRKMESSTENEFKARFILAISIIPGCHQTAIGQQAAVAFKTSGDDGEAAALAPGRPAAALPGTLM